MSLASFSFKAQAQVNVTAGCPVNLNLTYQEHSAYVGFHSRLRQLDRHFGRPTYSRKLNEILSESWPEEKVIDVSASFMEKTLNLIQQKHLENLMHQTVGLSSPNWIALERTIRNITIFKGTTTQRNLEIQILNLLKEIESLKVIDKPYIPVAKRRFVGMTDQELGVLKARAASALPVMADYLMRWSVINYEIIKQEAEAVRQKYIVAGIVLAAGTVSIVATVYMGSILATTAAISAGFATDIVVAANLARVAQIVVGAGIVGGGIGAPAFDIAIDAVTMHANANAAALINDTTYACEIQKRMDEWRARGVAPYLKTALRGAGFGVVFAGFTLHRVTAKMILGTIVPSVATAQATVVYGIVKNNRLSGEEVRQALLAHERGDKEAAIEHLRKSYLHNAEATSNVAKTALVGALSISIAGSIKSALASDEAITAMVSNSADTLPEVMSILNDVYAQTAGK